MVLRQNYKLTFGKRWCDLKEEDYEKYQHDLLNACLQFNTLFCEYVKQMDPALWKRAVDYAKDFTNSGIIKFKYVEERSIENLLANPLSQTIFVRELSDSIEYMLSEYIEFVNERKSHMTVDEIKKSWLKQTGYEESDPFNNENNLNFFIQCDHRFAFDKFDEDDWISYMNVTHNCSKNREFQERLLPILEKHLGMESKFYHYFVKCLELNDGLENN